jgi:hypothetical protein
MAWSTLTAAICPSVICRLISVFDTVFLPTLGQIRTQESFYAPIVRIQEGDDVRVQERMKEKRIMGHGMHLD